MESARVNYDVGYYEILGIEKNATQSQIKKAYYIKARNTHPDKNPDDPQAEETFKLVSEAYTVLSNEKTKTLYDQYGKSAVKSQGNGDVSAIISAMFGDDKFVDTFGELFLIKVANNPQDLSSMTGDTFNEDSKKIRKKLIAKLLIKLEPYVQGVVEGWKEIMVSEIKEKLKVPGGPQLLKFVGDIYLSKAKQYIGRYFGLQGIYENVTSKGQFVSQLFETASAVVKLRGTHQELETKTEYDPDIQEKVQNDSLNVMWKMGLIEINWTVSAVCEEILTDQTLPQHLRKQRAIALEALGLLYTESAASSSTTKTNNVKLNH